MPRSSLIRRPRSDAAASFRLKRVIEVVMLVVAERREFRVALDAIKVHRLKHVESNDFLEPPSHLFAGSAEIFVFCSAPDFECAGMGGIKVGAAQEIDRILTILGADRF